MNGAPAGGREGEDVPLGKLLLYSGPAVPMAILFVPLVIYLPPFYSAEMRLDLGKVGLIFFAVRLWDAIIDQLMGFASDRTRSRFGRRRIWMVAGLPLLMLAAVRLLDPPGGAGYGYLGLWVFVFYGAWTVVQIPYLSWGAELSDSYLGRNRVTSFREGATMLGIMLAVALPLLLLSGADSASIRPILGVILKTTLFALPLTVLLAVLLVGEPGRRHATASFFGALHAVAGNWPFLRLVAALLICMTASNIYNACVVFLIDVAMNLPGKFLLLVVVQYFSGIICVPLLMAATAKLGKHRTLCCGLVGSAAVMCGMAFIEPGTLCQAILAFACLGPAIATTLLLPAAIVADTVDLDTLRSGESRAGQYMAVLNFVIKMGVAIGVGIGLPLLGWLGYEPNGAHTIADIHHLRAVGLFLPALLLVPAAALLWNFPLSRHRSAVMRRWLQRRIKGDMIEQGSAAGAG